jgi:hypothetical protein
VLAEVALPEVEEIRVVYRRLPSFDFEENARLSERSVVVGTEVARLVASKQPLRLVDESEDTRVIHKNRLHEGARLSGLVRREDPGPRRRSIHTPLQSVSDGLYLRVLL